MFKILKKTKYTKTLNFFFGKNKLLTIKGVLKPKVFLVLFSLFFSSLALAAALTVTWVDGRIPSGNANCTSSQTGASLVNDRTTDPHDVQFSDDGLQVFTANLTMHGKICCKYLKTIITKLNIMRIRRSVIYKRSASLRTCTVCVSRWNTTIHPSYC